MARAQEGDKGAFTDLAGLHARRAWAVCYRITGSTHDAEDALQDALTAAWQHLDRFRGDARFGTWLHRIAANCALMVVRRRRELPVGDGSTGELAAMTAMDAFDRVLDVDLVQNALRGLPADFREALVLREYGDLSYEEIAVHQGVPVATVKTRLHRARRQLVDQLTPG